MTEAHPPIPAAPAAPAALDPTQLEAQAWQALRQVPDPEVGVNIVDLGLVYGLQLRADALSLRLTMTSAACPMAETILDDIEARLRPLLPEGLALDIELVFEPPWTPARMSPLARGLLGWP